MTLFAQTLSTRRPLLWLAFAALAVTSTARAEGDPEAGEQLAYTCMGCHGIDGYRNAYPSFRVPRLGGQREEYLVDALTAYKEGRRPHPTMQAQGGSLSSQDIEDIAAWFQGETVADDTVTADEVQGFDAIQTCLACHGSGGAAVIPRPPVLSGQQADYLVHALKQYKNGERTGNVMTAFATSLSDADMEMLAAFYAAREGVYTPEKGQ